MRILVVKDDWLLNNTLCYNRDAAGYVVDSALTKSAASDFLTKQTYDLSVLDVNMLDGNDFDFCRKIKKHWTDFVFHSSMDCFYRKELIVWNSALKQERRI